MNITNRSYSWAKPLSARSGKPKGIVCHHAAAASASAVTIHGWHIKNGWSGIGYHFVVRRDGTIERGRPEDKIGSHALGVNDRIGICVEGNLQTQTMPTAQRESLSWLIHTHLLQKYPGIPVTRHRDHASTACPGKNFPWPVPKPAAGAPSKPAAKPSQPSKPAAKPSMPLLRNGSRGGAVKTLQTALNKAAAKPKLKVDGIFGPATLSAVRAFQKRKKLAVDGIVGPKTWGALL